MVNTNRSPDSPERETQSIEADAASGVDSATRVSADSTELAAFSAKFSGYSFKLIPQDTHDGLQWAMWVFAENVQGPVLQTTAPISPEDATEFGIPESLRKRLNEGLRFTKRKVNLPPEFRRELKQLSLEDLEAEMEKRKPSDKRAASNEVRRTYSGKRMTG